MSDVLRDIISVSSVSVHDSVGLKSFDWQDGYSAFSVDWHNVARVRNYIRMQEEHHRSVSFRDEYLALLREHQIQYDPRYVF